MARPRGPMPKDLRFMSPLAARIMRKEGKHFCRCGKPMPARLRAMCVVCRMRMLEEQRSQAKVRARVIVAQERDRFPLEPPLSNGYGPSVNAELREAKLGGWK